jgi:hypothetical protein
MRKRSRTRVVLAVAGTGWLASVLAGTGQIQLTPSAMRNHPAINYTKTPPADPVALLNERLQRGEVTLEFDGVSGYLRSALQALGVPVESQLLVFSKTSFQAPKITPQNPRALYFNDTVSVGFVRGGEVLEFTGIDPRQGAMFYTLEQSAATPPQLRRDMSCVQCHTWDGTANVPGWFLGSVWPAEDGRALDATGYGTDHRTGFEVRWGGWYVTGKHAFPSHMGNAVVREGTDLGSLITPESVHVESLEGRFDMTGYPERGSDVVALMVLEHQARMSSLITRLGWEARLGADAGRPLRGAVEELVDYLLFVDEAELPGTVAGSSGFAETFADRGPRDSKGRSLRELDLETRLMRYPCSYMIYSEPFDALPAAAKRDVYARMWEILSGSDPDPRYARLSADDRRSVVDILRETKPDLPSYFSRLPSASY